MGSVMSSTTLPRVKYCKRAVTAYESSTLTRLVSTRVTDEAPSSWVLLSIDRNLSMNPGREPIDERMEWMPHAERTLV